MKALTSLIVIGLLAGLGWLIYTNVLTSSKVQDLNQGRDQRQDAIEALDE